MNLDPDKLVVLFVIALLVLGPNRLPEAARTLGRWTAELRKYRSALQGELHGLLGEPGANALGIRDEIRSVFAEPRAALDAGAREARGLVNSAAGLASAPFEAGTASAPEATLQGDALEPSVPLQPSVTVQPSVPVQAVPDDPGLN